MENSVPRYSEEKLSKSNWYTMKGSLLHKFPDYMLAARPWSFSASLTPVFLGFCLAQKIESANLIILLFTALTVVSVHAAGNIVNTYFDYIKGIDSRKSDDRTLVDEKLSKDELVTLGAFFYLIACAGFVVLSCISYANFEHLALVFFGGLSSSFLYTGGIGFKYIGLGDILIIIIFGPISVLFSFLVQTGQVQFYTILYALPLALNAEAILHSNNTRDMETDKKAGIVTLAIVIGKPASEILFALFILSPYSIFLIWGIKYSLWFLLPLFTLNEAFLIEKQFRDDKKTVPQWTAKLNFYVGLLFVLGCALTDKSKLPYSF